MHLSRIFGGSLNMVSEQLAESAELGLARVLLAELKGLHRSALVHNLESRIVSEDVENRSVRLPQKFQPRRDDCTISAISRLFAGDGRQEDGLRGLGSFEIIDAGGSCFESRLSLIRFRLGGLNLLFGELDKSL
jgi:hypothetical protein